MKKKATFGYVREAFLVRRYHTTAFVHDRETVGHHTAQVLAILFELFDGYPPLYLIAATLYHDAAELSTGDMPATTKWKWPGLASELKKVEAEVEEKYGLNIEIRDPLHLELLKYADMMDLCFKGVEEIASGNDMFCPILLNGLAFVRNQLDGPLKDYPQAHKLYSVLESNPFVDIKVMTIEHDAATGPSVH
jgi:5'-deoxynucleotidase YfbR-like HD superfamily hydrolase